MSYIALKCKIILDCFCVIAIPHEACKISNNQAYGVAKHFNAKDLDYLILVNFRVM